MKTESEIRQMLINILWSYDELSEYEIQKIVNEIIKKLEL